MTFLIIALQVLVVVLSLILGMFILMHKAAGGGVSDLFGGGMTNGLNSSGVAGKNLFRFTVASAIIWAMAIMGLGIITRFTGH